MILCTVAGLSESAQFAHVWRYFFACRAPFLHDKKSILGKRNIQAEIKNASLVLVS